MRVPAVPFELEVTEAVDDVVTFRVVGDVDLTSVGSLDRALDSLGQPTSLIVDLEAVSFLDTSGVRFLIRAHKHMDQIGRQLATALVDTEIEWLDAELG